jgi:hypothetical protein
MGTSTTPAICSTSLRAEVIFSRALGHQGPRCLHSEASSTFAAEVVLENGNLGHPASRAGPNRSFTRGCIRWRPQGAGCTGDQRSS